MQFRPLAPLEHHTVSLADRAYERLRDAIVDGALPSGSKLSERSLAVALDISAQPIREALRRLEGEGMVETRPRSGTFVARLDDDHLYEMGHIRAALEGAAAGLAARRARPGDVAALQIRLKEIEAATRRGDAAALAAANDAFHVTLHAATGNTFLIRSLQALRAYFHIGSTRVLAHPEQMKQALDEHTEIVTAITQGDAERAETVMRTHALRSLEVAFPQSSGAITDHPPQQRKKQAMTDAKSRPGIVP
jgi:DNA-binding GntR family transcriptional regulator